MLNQLTMTRAARTAALASAIAVTAALALPSPANADLGPDTSFSGDGFDVQSFTTTDQGTAIAVGADRVYVGSETGTDTSHLLAYTTSGELDATFGGGDGIVDLPLGTIGDIEALSSGKVIVVGSRAATQPGRALRLTTSGGMDANFSGDGILPLGIDVAGSAIDSQGRLVVGGTLVRDQGPGYKKSDFGVARIKTNGVLDANFSGDGVASVSNDLVDDVYGVGVDGNNRPLLSGTTADGVFDLSTQALVTRFTAGGQPDGNFSGNGKATTTLGMGNNASYAVGSDANNRVIVALTNSESWGSARFTQAGQLDNNYSGDGRAKSALNGASIYGASVLGGAVRQVGAGGAGFNEVFLGAVKANGTLDTNVGASGSATYDLTPADDYGNAVTLDTGGRVLVAGYNNAGSDLDTLTARLTTLVP